MAKYKQALLCGSSALVALFSTHANAQAVDDQRAATTGLAEIVVTAERVETTLQRTPISVAVVNEGQLLSRGVSTLDQIQNVEPTVLFSQGQNNGTTIAIRGVSSTGGQGFGGSSVTINMDGQYILEGFNGALFDIERVEILKGPLGTLYGLNATAGGVNIVTNAPQLGQVSGDYSLDFGNYSSVVARGAVNLPLGDTAALRVALYRNRHDGYREHPGLERTQLADIYGARVSALWRPTSALSVRLTGEYIDEDRGSSVLQGVVISDSPTTPAGKPPTSFTPDHLDPRTWPFNFQGYNTGFDRKLRGEIDYDFGWAHLTYLGGWRSTKTALFQPTFGTGTQVVDYQQTNWRESHQEELRLAGETDFGTRWQFGAFYLNYQPEDVTNVFNGLTRFHPVRTLPFIHFDDLGITLKNKALYGQITQALTDKLSLTGGLRYTKVRQTAVDKLYYPLNVGAYIGSQGAVIARTTMSANGVNAYNKTTWHVGADYQATSANLIYVSASTSFKDGGFTQINTFLPEDILAFEVGTKNRFFSGALQMNAAAYHYDYKNQQATAFVVTTPATPTTPAASAATTVNAGRSRLTGAELDVLWLATPDDQLSFAANYTDAEYTEFIAAQPVVPAGTVTAVTADLAGNTPPNAPKWILNVGYSHTFHLGAGELEVQANSRYSSAYHLSFYNLPGDRQDSFIQTDLTATYRAPSGRWELGAYVRNIEDNDVLNYAQFQVQGQGVFNFGWAPPRTYGVRLAANF